MKPLRVLSLFDGISCGRVALERAGIPVETYYASEIEKNAIEVSKHNYPEIIQIGDVTKIDFKEYVGKVDLVIGGSPCQDLSIAKANREGLSGSRSGLFFEFVRALEDIKPKYFLLENNNSMPKEAKDIISDILGVQPVLINSNKFSAQNRKRLYWCNWEIKELEESIDLCLSDIITEGYADRSKALCLARRYAGFQGSQSYLCRRYFGKSFGQAVFTSEQAYKEVKAMWKENPRFEDDGIIRIRALTPLECERLQTLPDNYTACLGSKNARIEAIGNGWTVDVIAYILKGIKE